MAACGCFSRRTRYIGIGLGAGILLTLPAALLAFFSAGGGHGDYVWTKAVFPYHLLVLELQSHADCSKPDPWLWFWVISPLAQFPIYGGLIGASATSRKRLLKTIGVIGGLHVTAVAACFLIHAPYFS